jgi:predicted permease
MIRLLQRLGLRLRALLHGAELDRDLQREMRAHIQLQIDEYIAEGMSPADARAAALRAFGPIAPVEEACRDTRRVQLITNLAQDARYALRALARQPMLGITATSSVALGVGANLIVFALASHLLLSAPTAERPEELVHIRTGNGSHVSYRGWRDLNDSHVLAGIAGYTIEDTINWRDRDASVTMTPLMVTANFFDVVGVPVARGRAFTAAEAQAERNPRLVVVSDGFWRRHLAADPAAVGRVLTLNGEPYVLVGILAPGIRSLPGYGVVPDLYLPICPALLPKMADDRRIVVQLIGRLAPGQTVAEGRAAVTGVAQALSARYGDREFRVITDFSLAGGVSQTEEFRLVSAFFLVLLVVSGLVLAIACANVAGLLLARGTTRRREMALRIALGAGRARLVQQLLTEGLILAVLGTAAGVGITLLAGRLFGSLSLPLPVPLELHLAFDRRLAALAAGMVAAATLLCGLAPALQATRPAMMPALKLEEPYYAHRRFTLRSVLVVGQVAISLVLLVTAAIFVRNLSMAHSLSPGFDVDRLLAAQVTFVEGRQGTAATPAIAGIVDRIRALPAVDGAAFAEGVPLTIRAGSRIETDTRIDDLQGPVRVAYDANVVGPGYFSSMGIRLLRGRDFTLADRSGAPRVAVVNEEFVRRYLGDDPLGRRLDLEGTQADERVEVIGVVANGKYRTLGEERDAAIFEPYLQHGTPGRLVHVLVRTAASPETVIASVRHAVARADPSAAVSAQPMASALRFAFLPSEIGAALLGVLGALGLLLAMVGLYGVVAFSVGRRTAEIGIRMALGASRRAVWRLVVGDAAVLVGCGTAAGLALAWFVTRPLGAFLVPELGASDPISFVVPAVLLATVGLLATWAPTRRALSIDPSITLRTD